MPTIAARHAMPDGIGAQRRTDRPLFDADQAGRQRSGTEQRRKIADALFGKVAAGDLAMLPDFPANRGRRAHSVIEHNGEIVIGVRSGFIVVAGEGRKLVAARRVQIEADRGCRFSSVLG